MNHKNFYFTQIPNKTNDVIFLKSPGPFLTIFTWWEFFPKNPAVTHNYIWTPNIMLRFRKKLMSQSQENLWADGRRDRQTIFYRTLPAEARGTTTFLQQVTAGNTPNLVLKKILRYFLKIPPLKKILQF